MTQPAPAGIAGLSVRELKPTGFKPVVVEFFTFLPFFAEKLFCLYIGGKQNGPDSIG